MSEIGTDAFVDVVKELLQRGVFELHATAGREVFPDLFGSPEPETRGGGGSAAARVAKGHNTSKTANSSARRTEPPIASKGEGKRGPTTGGLALPQSTNKALFLAQPTLANNRHQRPAFGVTSAFGAAAQHPPGSWKFSFTTQNPFAMPAPAPGSLARIISSARPQAAEDAPQPSILGPGMLLDCCKLCTRTNPCSLIILSS